MFLDNSSSPFLLHLSVDKGKCNFFFLVLREVEISRNVHFAIRLVFVRTRTERLCRIKECRRETPLKISCIDYETGIKMMNILLTIPCSSNYIRYKLGFVNNTVKSIERFSFSSLRY